MPDRYFYPRITKCAQTNTPSAWYLVGTNDPQCNMETYHIQRHEEPEPKVIPFADARIQEETMVIESGHATVADVTVMRS